MNIVSGKYHDGKIILDAPVDWAEGVPVQVSPTAQKIGITEAEWPKTREGIEEKIRRLDALEPVELTPEEEAEWVAARVAVKDYTIKKMNAQKDPFE